MRSPVVFSSDRLPAGLTAGSRARAWAESLMAGGYNGEAVVPDNDSPFIGHVELMAPAGAMLARSRANSLILTRRPEHVALDMDDRVTLFFNQGSAPMRTVQMGREAVLGAGEGILVAQDAPQILDGSRSGDVIVLILPRGPFDAWRAEIHDIAGRRQDCTSAPYRLVRGYSRMLVDEAADLSDAEAASVAQHITELTRLWLGVVAEETDPGGSTRVSRLLAIRSLIRRNFWRPDLSAQTIAQSLGLSERMIHHVVTNSGASFGQLVMEARLKAVHTRLIDPAYDAQPIHALAASCGFTEYATFFRSFRRRYGRTPKHFR